MEKEEFKTMLDRYEAKEKKSNKRLILALAVPIALTVVVAMSVMMVNRASQERVEAVEAQARASMDNDSLFEELARQHLLAEDSTVVQSKQEWQELKQELNTVPKEELKVRVEASLELKNIRDSLKIDKTKDIKPDPIVTTSHTDDGPGGLNSGSTTQVNRRDSVIVRYYKRSGDNERVVRELQRLGYIVNEKEVTPGTEGYETNVIYYGSEVSQRDVEMVALLFRKSGFPIKHIEAFKEDPGMAWKKKAIEVGWKEDVVKLQTYDPKRIKKDLYMKK
ncbi:MAG: hypothetical protein KDD36_09955 [Flavobacteriales bacterium]|nr:hypothetical protein [Flavobacteriales bacterium]